MNAWIALRRPLLVAFLLGCAVSLLTSGRLTLRLVAPATFYWSFVPLCEIGSLALVAGRRKIPFAQAIDRFFASQTAWLLWLAAFAAAYRWIQSNLVWYGLALAAFVWSAYRDFGFFRRLLERSPGRAVRDLAVQRLLCWTAALAIFAAPSIWQVLASGIGL